MQTIKTTLMRAAAMAIAVLTSASLMLHPGSLKAYDYWVDPVTVTASENVTWIEID